MVARRVHRQAYDAGEFRTMPSHGIESCKVVPGCHACEDLEVDYEAGVVFGSQDHRAFLQLAGAQKGLIMGQRIAQQEEQGALKVFPLAEGPRGLREVAIVGRHRMPDFHPHGLYFHAPTRTLAVINHRRDGDCVELFDVSADGFTLTYRASVLHPVLRQLNDLVLVGAGTAADPMRLYVTNWMYYTVGSAKAMVEMYGRFAWGYVVACSGLPNLDSARDGSQWQSDALQCDVAADTLKMPNGITASPDGKTVYVAASIDKGLHVYDREAASGNLTKATFIHAGSMLDNLWLDADTGDVWTASHARALTFLRYSRDHVNRKAPTQLLVVRGGRKGVGGAAPAWEEIAADGEGSLYSAATAVVLDKARDKLYAGAVHEEGILECDHKAA